MKKVEIISPVDLVIFTCNNFVLPWMKLFQIYINPPWGEYQAYYLKGTYVFFVAILSDTQQDNQVNSVKCLRNFMSSLCVPLWGFTPGKFHGVIFGFQFWRGHLRTSYLHHQGLAVLWELCNGFKWVKLCCCCQWWADLLGGTLRGVLRTSFNFLRREPTLVVAFAFFAPKF